LAQGHLSKQQLDTMAMKMKKMSAMKAMKSMKAKKAMSTMKKMKAMKVSIKGKKWQVFSGKKTKTVGGLQKKDLKKNKNGKVVSAKASAHGKKAYGAIAKWNVAVQKARKALGIKGFVAVGGKNKEGQAFLAKARSFYKK